MRPDGISGSAVERVVVIGGGASGVLASIRLISSTRAREVVLVDRRTHLARGVAYSTEDRQHLLNVPAGRMSAFPEEPDHFVRWLELRAADAGFSATSYVPRSLYGEYLRDLFNRAATSGRFTHVDDFAVDLEIDGARVVVTTGGNVRIEGDRVVLAIGNPRPRWPFDHEVAGRAIVDPFAPGALETVPAEGDVLIVGTGLTMVDLTLTLTQRGHRGTIHAISRRGLVPHPHFPNSTGWQFAPQDGPLTMRQLLASVRRESEAAEEAGVSWHAVIDAVRPHVSELWTRLPLAERRRFLRHVRPYWEIHRHRMAPSVGERFQSLIADGQVKVHRGRILTLSAHEDGSIDVLCASAAGGTLSVHAAAIVNASGPAFSPSGDPLIGALLGRDLARVDPLGLGLNAGRDGRLVDARGRPHDRIHAIGPLLRGVLWETTAIPEIREQARNLG